MLPQPGHIYRVTAKASVQFRVPILFRVIRIHEWKPYCDGWVWLDGYELNTAGDAVVRRSIYVQPAGLIDRTPSTPAGHFPPPQSPPPGRPVAATRPANRARSPRAYTDFEPHPRR